MRSLLVTVKILLFAAAFTPLVVGNAIFPHTFDKLIFFRVLIELALIVFLILLFPKLNNPSQDKKFATLYTLHPTPLLKNPIFLSLLVFFSSMTISAIFAVNPYRAFWGDLERGEGFFGIIHYFLFFILTIFIFSKKDWLIFLKLFCSIGIIVSTLAFIQLPYFHIQNLPSIIERSERPSSLLGNSTYLSSYLLFVIIFSLIIFIKSKDSIDRYGKIWRFFSLFIFFIAIVSVFIAKTRGVLVGLISAVIITLFYLIFTKDKNFLSFYPKISLKKISVFFLSAIIIFSIIFFLTKDNDLWQKVPGLDRLAKTDIFHNKDASTAVRLAGWKIAWDSFLEKPILGWGPESYLFIFNKNYIPSLSAYGDGLWLDRSHNKILDILSAQGIIGFLSYISVFASLFFIIIKNQNIRFVLKPIFIGGFVAYFVQNIFAFDNISSYIGFFALLGFVVSLNNDSKPNNTRSDVREVGLPAEVRLPNIKSINQSSITNYHPPAGGLITKTVIVILIVIVGYGIYAYNYTPYRQVYWFWHSTKFSKVEEVITFLKKAMSPYNFAQYNIRGKGVDLIYLSQYFGKEDYAKNPKFYPLGDILLEGMRELLAKEQSDVRMFIKTVEALNGLARARPEESAKFYKEAESILKKAVKISPKRQEVYYHLAFNLANQKHFNESIVIAQYAISLSSEVSRAHYHLAFMYYLADKSKESLDELALVEKIDSNFNNLIYSDINNLLFIYNKYNKQGKVAETVKKLLGGDKPIKRPFILMSLEYYAGIKDKNNFIKIAEYLKKHSEYKDAMLIFIEFAEKGLWETINASF